MIDIYNSSISVFQVDSLLARKAYNELDNFLIEYDTTSDVSKKICAIYFSGHSIYYPNTEVALNNNIFIKNRFEWYRQRVPEATKHIFVRDIHKQWYLSGINISLNSPELLLSFLRNETVGYEIVCIGSSAGGYAALLYGSLLNAKVIHAFSPRIYMQSLDTTSDESKNPLYFRLKNTTRKKYFDISQFIISSKAEIYCYYPIYSNLDKLQLNHIYNSRMEHNENFHLIKFKTKKHGVPFPKIALDRIISITYPISITQKVQIPIFFSIKQVGLVKTLQGILNQIKKYIRIKTNALFKL